MTQLCQYRLLDKVGSSILGAVYKAQDAETGSTVALKVLQLGLLDDVGSREMDARLQQAFERAARLLHPGIARVLEIRRDGTTALIATELVDGPTVTSFANARAGSDVTQAVTAVVQILEALDFAHRHGVIHRDLKPSNILVSHGTRTKITDFGMADLGARNRDDTGMLVGETEYMAPEQFLGRDIDKRCDIHAVGTILYELLTGKSPLAADASSFSAMTKVLNFVPPPPSTVRPGVSASFDRVVGRALAKSPADRFATAWEFRDELCAAYFALMRRAPPDTLARVPIAQDLLTPSAPRTITTRRTPLSRSPNDPARDGKPGKSALEAPRDDLAEKTPPQSTAESLGSSPVDLSATPHRAAVPTPPEPTAEPSAPVEVAAWPNASSLAAPGANRDGAPAPVIRGLRERAPAASPSRTPPAVLGQAPPLHVPDGLPSADVRSDAVAARAAPLSPKRSVPLTEASIAHGGRVLARFVGPIAIVLSRRAAQDAHDERGYFDLLAAHLSDPKERAQFFRDIRQRH